MSDSEDDEGDYCYIPGLSMAGFVSPSGRCFTLMNADKSFITTPLFHTVCASTMGLLLLRDRQGPDLIYSVCNPFLTNQPRREIPKPPRDHPDHIPRVLVVNWDSYHLRLVFHIVCALPVEELLPDSHTYSFDIFSSHNDQWETRTVPQNESTGFWQIRGNTGVSCGDRVFWLLDKEHRIVIYDSHDHFVRFVQLPRLVQTPGNYSLFRMQLGRWAKWLCLNVVYFDEIWIAKTYVWLTEDDWVLGKWTLASEIELDDSCTLSRFESAKLQVPFWTDRALELCENRWKKDGSRLIARSKKLPVARGDPEDQMPYVTSCWHPKDHFPATPSPDD